MRIVERKCKRVYAAPETATGLQNYRYTAIDIHSGVFPTRAAPLLLTDVPPRGQPQWCHWSRRYPQWWPRCSPSPAACSPRTRRRHRQSLWATKRSRKYVNQLVRFRIAFWFFFSFFWPTGSWQFSPVESQLLNGKKNQLRVNRNKRRFAPPTFAICRGYFRISITKCSPKRAVYLFYIITVSVRYRHQIAEWLGRVSICSISKLSVPILPESRTFGMRRVMEPCRVRWGDLFVGFVWGINWRKYKVINIVIFMYISIVLCTTAKLDKPT